jgi:DNA-directed RNA polymerase specialized sigma24 family protein
MISAAINHLDPKLQIPLRIRMSQKCSAKELAELLGTTVPSVKARLHRARKQVLEFLSRRNCASISAGHNRAFIVELAPESANS